MNELESALAEAIEATRTARNAIYDAASAADDAACDIIRFGDPISGAAAGMREGELLSFASMMSSMLTNMRAMRRDVAKRAKK